MSHKSLYKNVTCEQHFRGRSLNLDRLRSSRMRVCSGFSPCSEMKLVTTHNLSLRIRERPRPLVCVHVDRRRGGRVSSPCTDRTLCNGTQQAGRHSPQLTLAPASPLCCWEAAGSPAGQPCGLHCQRHFTIVGFLCGEEARRWTTWALHCQSHPTDRHSSRCTRTQRAHNRFLIYVFVRLSQETMH